ncbi:uncharacterized protein DUF2490 [Novosphingobium kunmingense]|uniref:Uncharacterized protein DUF2490 n=1 Tax=Novosphingobium kunmingense TaxID=1211806 RepID=A0A2N0I1W4_9SPHN|nr:DUF2490 domain-containing protein [Novosphingobium kunmingense]PKB25189.1 uncharacterized protein DUF2490 [Novosphingobium kunmingense]
MRKILVAAAASAVFVASSAQAAEDEQFWQTLSVGVGLTPDLKLTNELVARVSDARGFYELENSTMLNYKVSKQVTLAAGYVHNPTYSHGDFSAMEHRAREQVTFDNIAKLGPVKLSARLRMEQRWRDNAVGTGWRLRPYVKASAPFVGKSTLNVSHESFVNLNTTAFQRVEGYDRMRNAVSIAVPLNKQIGIEVGYLNQLGVVRRGPDNMDHAATVAISANF